MHVLSFLEAEDLTKTAHVSKNWHASVEDQQLWRLLNLTKFGKCKKPEETTWKTFVISNIKHLSMLVDDILMIKLNNIVTEIFFS